MRRVTAALALACGAATAVDAAPRANQRATAAAAEDDKLVVLPPYIVSATRIEKRPWRYASLPGFEVLSRASDEATNWWLDALRRGLWLEDHVLPKDWLSPAPAPYTVIIDDTDFDTVRGSPLHSQPIQFRSPADALTWGQLSGKANVWTGRSEAHDDDTLAANTNVFAVDPGRQAYGSISLERLFRCTPPLPHWLIVGLLGNHCGVFRQSFMPLIDEGGMMPRLDIRQGGLVRGAVGPGTLWVSLDETQRLLQELKKDKKTRMAIPPLHELFGETMPPIDRIPLWESAAGLFVRWGVMGPGHKDPALSHAFLEFVRRTRRAPVSEPVFTECFGFGYAVMEGKLESLLKTGLAQPNTLELDFPSGFPETELRPATADQIGRILGDWLRMQGSSLRKMDPALSEELLSTAGRMLLRAYQNDNGLPPDVAPAGQVERPARPAPQAAPGPVVVLEPFVVTAARIHDPGLLAVYGLYEHDTGRDTRAREFLEQAVQTGVVRPRACLVLAELRYADARGKPLGAQGKLSAGQAAAILEPLQLALRSSSAPDLYNLFLATWEHSEAKPAAGDVARIVEGVALFPRNAQLAFRSALVCAQSGYAVEAVALMNQSLVFASEKSRRDYFERLRAALDAPAVSGTRRGE